MKNRDILIIVLMLIIYACIKAQAQPEHQLKYSIRQCNEEAIELHLDPLPIQDFLGSEFPLVIEEGKARMVIIVHDCSQYWIDGKFLGPAQDLRVWVLIHGADDIRPVVGAQQTLPTRTWFALLSGSNNQQGRAADLAIGINQIPIDSVSVDSLGLHYKGCVFIDGKMTFKWNAISQSAPLVKLIGLNHDVYSKDSKGEIIFNRIQALMNVYTRYIPGTLEVINSINGLPFIKPGTYEVLVSSFFPMWSRATLGLSSKSKVVNNK